MTGDEELVRKFFCIVAQFFSEIFGLIGDDLSISIPNLKTWNKWWPRGGITEVIMVLYYNRVKVKRAI